MQEWYKIRQFAKDNRKPLLYVAGAVLLGLVVFRTEIEIDNEVKIRTLHPKIRDKVRKFLRKLQSQGYNPQIVSAYRSYDEQALLYAQGRTTAGKIVTNARPGYSYHNFGLAIDLIDRIKGYKADYMQWAETGKSLGFEWGGTWTGFIDKPHYQMTLGYSTAVLRNKYNNGEMVDNYVNI